MLKKIIAFLDENDISFAVIGGIANAERGRPRATEDADLKVLIKDKTISEFRALAESRFVPHRRPWLGKAESALIVSVEVEPEMVVDMLVAVFPYEEFAIQRAEIIEIDGVPLPICTAEDLIIHKAISNRSQDWIDIEGVLIRQRGKLDVKYIRHWLSQFAEALENPEIMTRFNQLYETI
ncbi:MAG: nucleotidyltransferase [Anaerolineales bacterium]|nr:nucleotidyltransferase [Anaerolineales bacterium]